MVPQRDRQRTRTDEDRVREEIGGIEFRPFPRGYEGSEFTGEKAGVRLRDDGAWVADCDSHQGVLNWSILVYRRFDGAGLDAEIKEYHWERGQPKVRMIRQSEGFCFISHVAGHFSGGGERVSVVAASDGYWYLDCQSGQDMAVEAISVKPRNLHTFIGGVREVAWKTKMPPIALLGEDEGICLLTCIQGAMADEGDGFGLKLGEDGFWYVYGKGRMLEVHALALRYVPETK